VQGPAERLLSKVGYDTEREMHTLELLKLRFGEASLHKCEVRPYFLRYLAPLFHSLSST